jgi:tetratricopeptide (TPR) repeat protein
MPAHIYIRVGKYHDGSLANEMAVKSDEAYLTQCRMQGLYPTAYYPHNYHFLWATATLEGRSKTALDAAQKVSEKVQDSMMTTCGYSTLQHFYVIPYYAYVRFGRWNEILNSPKPSDDTPYAQAVWHYARGMAMVANNKLEEADNELQELVKYESNEKVSQLAIWGINYAGDLVKIAKELLTGEIAAKQKNYNLAIIHLQKAIEVEYKLRYDEPPTWFHQVSHHLGAVLLEAGKYKDAEKVYRDDLAEFPENGWALFGLLQSLKMQGKDNEVVEVEKRFKEAWKYADIELKSSRII